MSQVPAQFVSFMSTYTLFACACFVSAIWLIAIWTMATVAYRSLSKRPAVHNELSGEAAARYWQHALHEDNAVNSTLNFFILLQSVLLGMVGALVTRQETDYGLLSLFAVAGLIVTLLWVFIQARRQFILDSMIPRLLVNFPEYAETTAWRRLWPLRGSFFVSYLLPLTAATLWTVLLAIFQRILG